MRLFKQEDEEGNEESVDENESDEEGGDNESDDEGDENGVEESEDEEPDDPKLFLGNKIELPVICENNLTDNQLEEIAENA